MSNESAGELFHQPIRLDGVPEYLAPELHTLISVLNNDREILHTVYQQVRANAGVTSPFVLPSELSVGDSRLPATALYSPLTPNKVHINTANLHEQFTDIGVESTQQYGYLLRVVMHEYFHALSNATLRSTTITDAGYYYRSGFSRNNQGNALNEAMTEHLAQMLFGEFALQSSNAELSALANDSDFQSSSYANERTALYLAVLIMSGVTGVTQEDVWRTLITQYFTGRIPHKKFARSFENLHTYVARNVKMAWLLENLAKDLLSEEVPPEVWDLDKEKIDPGLLIEAQAATRRVLY